MSSFSLCRTSIFEYDFDSRHKLVSIKADGIEEDNQDAAFLFFSIFRKKRKNINVVTAAAMKSETGSARKTAKALSAKKLGRMKIKGINRMTFRSKAITRDIFACPSAIKACWQLI